MSAGGMIAAPFQLAGGVLSAYASLEAGKYNYKAGMFNANAYDMEAQDLLVQGKSAEQDILREGVQINKAQESSYAAQGVEVTSGSALEVQEQTEKNARLAANTKQLDYMRAAWSKGVAAHDSRKQAKFALRESRYQAFSSLLGAGGSAASGVVA
jgi:hypothetical protein